MISGLRAVAIQSASVSISRPAASGARGWARCARLLSSGPTVSPNTSRGKLKYTGPCGEALAISTGVVLKVVVASLKSSSTSSELGVML